MSKFKLFIIAVLAWFVVSSSGADITFDAVKVKSLSVAAQQMSSEMLYDDHAAARRVRLARHTVLIRESVKVRTIAGIIIEVEQASSGSGVVIAYDEDRDIGLVMTANHVCETSFPLMSVILEMFLVIDTEPSIVNYNGEVLQMEVIYTNPDDDVCVIEVDGNPGVPATIAPFMPPLQALVQTVGAPEGEWDVRVANIVEGYFSGILTKSINDVHENFAQYSLPIVGGMSGSAVYYRGRIIGLLTHGSTSAYDHLAWGPALKPVKKAYDEAMELWRE